MRPLAILALLAQACASAPRPLPALPPRVDPLAGLPPAPGLVVPPTVPRYPEVRVRKGDCPGQPAGILVSPAVYAELYDEVSQRKRLAGELAAVTRLREAERSAAEALERAYRQRLAEAGDGSPWRTVAVALVVGVVGLVAGGILAGRPAR